MRGICVRPQNEVQHETIQDQDMAKHESIMNFRIWYKIHLFKISKCGTKYIHMHFQPIIFNNMNLSCTQEFGTI